MCCMTLPRSEAPLAVPADSLELVVSSSRSSGLEDVSDLPLTRLGGAALLERGDLYRPQSPWQRWGRWHTSR